MPPFAFALLLAASAGVAQPPAPQGPPRLPGISPAGNATIAQFQRRADPEGQALIAQQRAFGQKMVTILNAPAIDLDRLAAAMREGQALQARARALTDTRLLAMLRALPPADRKPFVRLAVTGGQRPPQAAAR